MLRANKADRSQTQCDDGESDAGCLPGYAVYTHHHAFLLVSVKQFEATSASAAILETFHCGLAKIKSAIRVLPARATVEYIFLTDFARSAVKVLVNRVAHTFAAVTD